METITASVRVARSPERVFQALTDPDEIPRHFPLERAESEGRVGGRFLLYGRLGDAPFTDHGTIVAWEAGRVFAYRYWSSNHDRPRAPESELLIRYELEPDDDGTLLTVTQGRITDVAYAEQMRGAWPALLSGLAASLTG